MGKEEHEFTDPLTDFMFGRRPQGEKEYRGARKRSADDWFLGRSSHRHEHTNEELPLLDLLNQIDIEKLSANIDTLMTTASQFKPLIKEIKPLIKKWVK